MKRSSTQALLASGLLALVLAPGAGAEVAQKQGVRVAVDGALSPSTLPRAGTAPVSVEVSGEIKALEESELPQLKALTIAINRAGILDLRGIPRCRIGHINPSTTRQAQALCRRALVGEGHFSANVVLPEQSPFPSEGKLLAFNGTIGRRPAIFAHVYGTKPLSTSYVFAFRVTRRKGTFGTVLSASFPRATGDWGYITGISLRLNRRFLRAGCPAPPGFEKVVFPLARTSFEFAGGLDIPLTMTRSCRASG
jgi:hypothetical protein